MGSCPVLASMARRRQSAVPAGGLLMATAACWMLGLLAAEAEAAPWDLDSYDVCRRVELEGIEHEASGVTYSPVTNTIFVITRRPRAVAEYSLEGELQRTVKFDGVPDPEGIAWMHFHTFAIVGEYEPEIKIVTIWPWEDSASVTRTIDLSGVVVGANAGSGLEGIAYDKRNALLYVFQEQDPKLIWRVTLDGQAEPLPHLEVEGINDVSGGYITPDSQYVVMVSQRSKKLLKMNMGSGERLMRTSVQEELWTPEGVTFVPDGSLMFVVGEPNLLIVMSSTGSCTYQTPIQTEAPSPPPPLPASPPPLPPPSPPAGAGDSPLIGSPREEEPVTPKQTWWSPRSGPTPSPTPGGQPEPMADLKLQTPPPAERTPQPTPKPTWWSPRSWPLPLPESSTPQAPSTAGTPGPSETPEGAAVIADPGAGSGGSEDFPDRSVEGLIPAPAATEGGSPSGESDDQELLTPSPEDGRPEDGLMCRALSVQTPMGSSTYARAVLTVDLGLLVKDSIDTEELLAALPHVVHSLDGSLPGTDGTRLAVRSVQQMPLGETSPVWSHFSHSLCAIEVSVLVFSNATEPLTALRDRLLLGVSTSEVAQQLSLQLREGTDGVEAAAVFGSMDMSCSASPVVLWGDGPNGLRWGGTYPCSALAGDNDVSAAADGHWRPLTPLGYAALGGGLGLAALLAAVGAVLSCHRLPTAARAPQLAVSPGCADTNLLPVWADPGPPAEEDFCSAGQGHHSVRIANPLFTDLPAGKSAEGLGHSKHNGPPLCESDHSDGSDSSDESLDDEAIYSSGRTATLLPVAAGPEDRSDSLAPCWSDRGAPYSAIQAVLARAPRPFTSVRGRDVLPWGAQPGQLPGRYQRASTNTRAASHLNRPDVSAEPEVPHWPSRHWTRRRSDELPAVPRASGNEAYGQGFTLASLSPRLRRAEAPAGAGDDREDCQAQRQLLLDDTGPGAHQQGAITAPEGSEGGCSTERQPDRHQQPVEHQPPAAEEASASAWSHPEGTESFWIPPEPSDSGTDDEMYESASDHSSLRLGCDFLDSPAGGSWRSARDAPGSPLASTGGITPLSTQGATALPCNLGPWL